MGIFHSSVQASTLVVSFAVFMLKLDFCIKSRILQQMLVTRYQQIKGESKVNHCCNKPHQKTSDASVLIMLFPAYACSVIGRHAK